MFTGWMKWDSLIKKSDCCFSWKITHYFALILTREIEKFKEENNFFSNSIIANLFFFEEFLLQMSVFQPTQPLEYDWISSRTDLVSCCQQLMFLLYNNLKDICTNSENLTECAQVYNNATLCQHLFSNKKTIELS